MANAFISFNSVRDCRDCCIDEVCAFNDNIIMFIFLVRNARHAIQIKGVQFAGKIYSEKEKKYGR